MNTAFAERRNDPAQATSTLTSNGETRAKDKSWVIAEAEQPAVWRKAAMVSATVLDRGRIVATWSHRIAAAGVSVEVSPLSRWHDGLIEGVHTEAAHFAAHLEVPLADVRVVAAST